MTAYKNSLILLVAMLTAVPWGFSLIIQKAENRGKSTALHLKTSGVFVLLFGLTPGKDFVYVGPAIIQIWSLVYLAACLIAAGFWGGDGILEATRYVYFGGIVIMAIPYWVAMILKKK